MRNGVPSRGRHRLANRPTCEPLETRMLLSAATTADLGATVATTRGASGQVHVTTYDRATGLDTQLAFLFQRDVLGPQSVTFDAYAIDVQLFDHATQALVAHFGEIAGSPQADHYHVVLTITDTTMLLSGTFILPNYGDTPLADQDATIAVDIAWSRQSVVQHIENTSLMIDGSSRQLIDSVREDGTATVVASAAWVQPGPGLRHLLNASTSVISGERAQGTLGTTISHTADIPVSMNLTPLVQSLAPPAKPPAGARVSSLNTLFGYVLLSPPEGEPTGSVALYGDSALLGYGAVIDGNNAFINGRLDTGVNFAPDALHASARGEGTANIDGAGPGFVTVPFSLDVQWNARPDTLALAFHRTITSVPGTTTIAYSQVTQYTATVTGEWSIGAPAPHYTLATEGLLNLDHFVTIQYPAGPAAPAAVASNASPAEWRAIAVEPWRMAFELAREHDLLSPSPAKRPLVRPPVKIPLVRLKGQQPLIVSQH